MHVKFIEQHDMNTAIIKPFSGTTTKLRNGRSVDFQDPRRWVEIPTDNFIVYTDINGNIV